MKFITDKAALRAMQDSGEAGPFFPPPQVRDKWDEILDWRHHHQIHPEALMRDVWAKLSSLLGKPPLYKRQFEYLSATWGLLIRCGDIYAQVILSCCRRGITAEIRRRDERFVTQIIEELHAVIIGGDSRKA